MSADSGELLRAPLFHTPRNPFFEDGALVFHQDGGLLIRDGRIAACGDYSTLRAENPLAEARDMRGGFLLPGLVDAHIHFPQLRMLGTLWDEACSIGWNTVRCRKKRGWAMRRTLPQIAREFVHALASHGTTTAMVFGAHFSGATEALFEAAEAPAFESPRDWSCPIVNCGPILLYQRREA